jgi:glycosyltransferase involved in cell wall biosynthesis
MTTSVAVVIPCFRVREHILDLLSRIGPEVTHIFVVDDACPEKTGEFVHEFSLDPRVCVLRHDINRGVGAAVMTGYAAALQENAVVLVKIDGDGQMDPRLIPQFIAPIIKGQADYTKGNRFYDLREIGQMPIYRLMGNAALSFMSKLSTGYWNLFDTTNGFTALHSKIARHIAFDKVSQRYFFETDMLFRLNIARAVVVDIPMDARYGKEVSSLHVWQVAGEFLGKHTRNFAKRIVYNYFLRDMTVASLELLFGVALSMFGVVFGCVQWVKSLTLGMSTPLGTIMLAALPTMLGIQMLLAFVAFDVANVPRRSIHVDLPD